MSAIARQLESIVGASDVCSWDHVSEETRARILMALKPGSNVACVVYPSTPEALVEVVTCAHKNRWRMLPCGSGSKLKWGGLTEGIDLVISTARLNQLRDHAVGDLTVTAEAGLRFADLQATLAQSGQFLALDPAYPQQATLGGIVATADAGAWRQRYGGVRDMVIGLSFVRHDGKVAKAGGRVVKNVAGYDLMKLLTGSYGTLGILSQLTFRVYPLAIASQTVVVTGPADAIQTVAQRLLASALTPTAFELLSPQAAQALTLGQDMTLVSRFQSIAVSVEKQAALLLELAKTAGLTGYVVTDTNEADLWQRLRELFEPPATESAITCKIGVFPSNAVATLQALSTKATGEVIAVLHASSGLGKLKLNADAVNTQVLSSIRTFCESQGGFLSVQEAPSDLKRQFEVWGYSGNALDVMRSLKQQFDPDQVFSPYRFVGGI